MIIVAQHFVIIISIGVNFVFILLDGIFNDGCSPRFNVVGSRLQIIGGTLLKCTRESSCSMSTRSTCLVFPVLEYCPWMIMDTPRCENPRFFLTFGFYVKSIFGNGNASKTVILVIRYVFLANSEALNSYFNAIVQFLIAEIYSNQNS